MTFNEKLSVFESVRDILSSRENLSSRDLVTIRNTIWTLDEMGLIDTFSKSLRDKGLELYPPTAPEKPPNAKDKK